MGHSNDITISIPMAFCMTIINKFIEEKQMKGGNPIIKHTVCIQYVS
jgi:hypothetical protein